MDPETRRVMEMAHALDKLPVNNKPGGLSVTLTPPTVKCVCGKMIPDITGLDSLNTGVILAVSDVCKNCKEGHKYDASKARLVCVKCKRVVMHINPCRDKIDGFEFKAGKSYHLEGCPQCTGKDGEYKIIEKFLYKKKLNLT